LLAKYESTKGVAVKFGVAFNAYDGFDFDGTLNSFALKANISSTSNETHSAFTYKIIYSDNSHLNAQIIIGVYAYENDELTFVNAKDGVFSPVSYNSILSTLS
jgi:hypothetical protein